MYIPSLYALITSLLLAISSVVLLKIRGYRRFREPIKLSILGTFAAFLIIILPSIVSGAFIASTISLVTIVLVSLILAKLS